MTVALTEPNSLFYDRHTTYFAVGNDAAARAETLHLIGLLHAANVYKRNAEVTVRNDIVLLCAR